MLSVKDVLLIGWIGATVISCNSRSGELPPEKMKELVWDLSRAEAFQTYYLSRDSSRDAKLAADTVYGKIFALHGVSVVDFKQTLNAYRKDPKKFKILLDSVNAYGNRIRERSNAETHDSATVQ